MFIYLFICFYFIFIHPQDGQMGAFFFSVLLALSSHHISLLCIAVSAT